MPKDERRWPEVQAHLMAQALAGLKLVTIAKGFDEDFDDLAPQAPAPLSRGADVFLGLYGAVRAAAREVLEEAERARGPGLGAGLDPGGTGKRATCARSAPGWFGTVEREIFALDPFGGRGADTGATRTQRAIILPQRPFQVLAELDPPGFAERAEVRGERCRAGAAVLSGCVC